MCVCECVCVCVCVRVCVCVCDCICQCEYHAPTSKAYRRSSKGVGFSSRWRYISCRLMPPKSLTP
ncbi:MAG: hypothetical protein P4L40_00025 [Terracidiphilus sp.]|nr:hypothetical protein [Terracidiphilus sp.]